MSRRSRRRSRPTAAATMMEEALWAIEGDVTVRRSFEKASTPIGALGRAALTAMVSNKVATKAKLSEVQRRGYVRGALSAFTNILTQMVLNNAGKPPPKKKRKKR